MKSSIIVASFALCVLAHAVGATEIGPGPVTGDWNASGNPYNINGEIIVPAGETLNIHEGVEVIFQGHYKLIVNGCLVAVGTQDSPILFTAAQILEGWHGIRFIDTPDTSRLTWCIIEYGRAFGVDMYDPDGWGGGTLCYNSNPEISYCTFRENSANWSGGGIFFYLSDTEITESTFTGNSAWDGGGGYGRYSTLVFKQCEFSDNVADVSSGGFEFHDSIMTVEDCTISGNYSGEFGGGIGGGWGGHLILRNCWIIGNTAELWGGGVAGDGGEGTQVILTITDNIVIGNSALAQKGGGVYAYRNCTGNISNNIIFGNYGNLSGGGITLWDSCSMEITNNLVFGNTAAQGAGIWCADNCTASIRNTTITGNEAAVGGGIWCAGSSMAFENMILWANSATVGKEIWIGVPPNPSTLTIEFSDLEGGETSTHVGSGCTLIWGEGMIDENPEFCTGPGDDDHRHYYLQHTECGDPVDSPCISMGDSTSELIQGTTRTDLVQDWGVVDMGYHYPREVEPFITVGPGPSNVNPALVRVFPAEPAADPLFEFSAYGAPFGVNVTCGDLNVNEMDEIVTGPGPGQAAGPHVRGFQVDGTPLPGISFLAYGTNKYGVNVAAGDIDGDGFDEIITGAGPGAVFGPHVRGWNYDGTGSVTAMPGVSYFAYGTPKWGVNVSAGDIDGDGYDEIVTGAGPGAVYGPHVRGWNVDGGPATAMPQVSFLAYSTNKYGVNITCGDVDGDGIDEIITAPGPGSMFGAHVRGFEMDGTPLPGLSFFAWPPSAARYGATVYAGADLNGNGRDDIVVGPGPDPAAETWYKVYLYDGEQVTEWFSSGAFMDLGLTGGVNVAAGRF